MNGRVGETVRLWGHFIESSVGKTGLTVTVDIQTTTGTVSGLSATAGDIDGQYYYDWTTTTSGYIVYSFQTATTTVDQMHLGGQINIDSSDSTAAGFADAVLDELLAGHATAGSVGAKLSSISAGSVTVISPVSAASTSIELVRSDDYYNTDGRALSFSSTGWADLTSATPITLTVRKKPGSGTDASCFAVGDTTGSRVTGSGTEQTVLFEVASSDTANIIIGTDAMKYDIQATLANTHKVTLATGLGTGVEDQTRST